MEKETSRSKRQHEGKSMQTVSVSIDCIEFRVCRSSMEPSIQSAESEMHRLSWCDWHCLTCRQSEGDHIGLHIITSTQSRIKVEVFLSSVVHGICCCGSCLLIRTMFLHLCICLWRDGACALTLRVVNVVEVCRKERGSASAT